MSMGVSLREAARRSGVRPSTIFRAILSSRLRYARDEEGSYIFDEDELEKVFSRDRVIERAPMARQSLARTTE